MGAYLSGLWGRITVHWHVIAVAFVAALPQLLDWLGVIDVKPILVHFLPEHLADFIVAILPFALAVLRPMIVVSPPAPEEDE